MDRNKNGYTVMGILLHEQIETLQSKLKEAEKKIVELKAECCPEYDCDKKRCLECESECFYYPRNPHKAEDK